MRAISGLRLMTRSIDAWLYQMGQSGLERVQLEDTEHYVVARRVLSDPHAQISKMLGLTTEE